MMQNRFTIAAIVFALVLFLTFTAAAQSSGQQTQTSPQSQTGPQSASPASPSAASPQSSTTTTESTSQTTSSPQSSSPAATPGQAASNAPQGHPGSVEEELQLTADQKAKLQPIIQDEISQINAVRNDTSLSMDQKRAKVQQIKQTSFPKILAVLTPEQQKKLSDMQQRAQREAQQQQQMNQSPASQSPSGATTPDASQSGAGAGQPGMGRPGASQPGMGQPGAAPGATPPTAQPPH
jgi:periplasmic protein CpxP/Spy